MMWLFLCLALALATQIWLCVRVGRSSVALAILTFLIGPPGAVYTFFKHRGEEDTSVTLPFIANLLASVLLLVVGWQVAVPLLEAQVIELERAQGLHPALPALPAERKVVAAAPAAASAGVVASSAAASSVASAASAGGPAASAVASAADPIEAFSAALQAAGLRATVTRLPASSSLPAGVTDAALIAVSRLGAAANAASAASAGGSAKAGSVAIASTAASTAPATPGELSVTLFRCESAAACRNLAGVYMQQGGADKRRVLQNGLLMLSAPPALPDDPDLTPTAVVSAFRRLSF